MRQHKISVCKIVRHWGAGRHRKAKDFWRVIWWDAAGRHRKFYPSEEVAEYEAGLLRRRQEGLNADWLELSQAERDRVVIAVKEAKARNVDLLALVLNAPAAGAKAVAPPFEKVLVELLGVKERAGLSLDYRSALNWTARQFARGRERLPVDRFTAADCAGFVNSKAAASRPSARARVGAVFGFAVRRKYRAENPMAEVELAKALKRLPVVMSPGEVAGAIKWFIARPPLPSPLPAAERERYPNIKWLGWFILTAFAGLRPEEAMKFTAAELHLSLGQKKPFIEVTPGITKTGHWRIVYPLPVVVRALKWALKNGAVLPLTRNGKVKFQKKLRAVIGWAKWPQDVTRHSAGSAWLALTNDQGHVIEMLGHSERIFRSHYKKPMQKAQAQAYFAALKVLATDVHR